MDRRTTHSPLGLLDLSQDGDAGNSLLVTLWDLGHNAHGVARENDCLRVYLSRGERRTDVIEPRPARLRNWSYQQDVAKNYNKKVRTRTFQQGD